MTYQCFIKKWYIQEKSTAYILNSEDKGTVRKIKYDVPMFHKGKDTFRKEKVMFVQFQDSGSRYRKSAINVAWKYDVLVWDCKLCIGKYCN